MIDSSTMFQKVADVIEDDLDDSIVVGDPSGSRWLILKGTATDVWHLLDRPEEVASLVAVLAKRYNGSPEQIHQDVSSLLDRLRKLGIVSVVL